jgi:hypothetical protein
MEKRKFTKEAKIIKEASEQGVKQTLEKYSVFLHSYYTWKKKEAQWERVFQWNDPRPTSSSRTGKRK